MTRYSAKELREHVGLSYRQIHDWARRGILDVPRSRKRAGVLAWA